MSVILKGFGRDVDSMSSIVAFGLAVNPVDEAGVVEAIQAADITQLFVVDYGGQRRKPSAAEWRMFKRMSKHIDMDTLYFRQKKSRKVGKIEIEWYVKPLPKFRKAA